MKNERGEISFYGMLGMIIVMGILTTTLYFKAQDKETPTPTVGDFSIEQMISTTPRIPTPTPTPIPEMWWLSQNFNDLQYDCGSAAILMITRFYGLPGPATVEELHSQLAGGDYPLNYKQVVYFLEAQYDLETEVVVTYEPIIPMLEEAGFDTSEIQLVEDIPPDTPAIWIYLSVDHWVVRYDGYNYDPAFGMYPFDQTAELRQVPYPELGLAILVRSVQ